MSPSPAMPFQEQLIYKLAALDASVQSGFRRLDDRIERIQSDLHDSQMNVNDRINRLDNEVQAGFLRKRTRLDALEKDVMHRHEIQAEIDKVCHRLDLGKDRLEQIERWQGKIVAQGAVVLAVLAIFWTFFSPAIRHMFGIPG